MFYFDIFCFEEVDEAVGEIFAGFVGANGGDVFVGNGGTEPLDSLADVLAGFGTFEEGICDFEAVSVDRESENTGMVK